MCFKMISPGYVGVVVDLFGSSKGVETHELSVGMHWIAPWKKIYVFPVFEQNDTWEKNEAFQFQTCEGLACSADIGITYHLRPEKVPEIFGKYRRGLYEITHLFLRNHIRDAINKAASKKKIEDLYSTSKEMFFEEIELHVQEDVKKIGIEISRIYLIGRFHFPDQVIHALNDKITAIQRAQQRENELREAQAEAQKLIAKAQGDARIKILAARAESKSNLIISESITTELLILKALNQWDGRLPQVIGPTLPMVDLNAQPTSYKEKSYEEIGCAVL
jgi:regulator of protease activity HflC (stomatin/prohibitin superfamily)